MARSRGPIYIADNSVTAINDALQQLIFMIDEISGQHDNSTIQVGPHTHAGATPPGGGPPTDGGPVDITLDHDDLINVTSDQHHAQLHETSHREGAADELKLDDAGTPEDNTDNDATTGHHGLLPKLSGSSSDALRGDGTFGPVTASEATDVANVEGCLTSQIWEHVLAGSGITITEQANGEAIKIDSAATGSLAMYSADATPASPTATDDEFADASGGVPGGWSEVDFGTTLTVSEDTQGLVLEASSVAGGEISGIYKAIPAGDFTIWTKVSISGIYNTDQVLGGLAFWEDATSSSGDVTTYSLFIKNGANCQLAIFNWLAYNSFSSQTLNINIGVNPVPTHLYLRVRRTGTTYSYDFSTDGVGWIQVSSGSIPSFTPTHFGPHVYNSSTGVNMTGRFPFFRYVASDVTKLGLVLGNRI